MKKLLLVIPSLLLLITPVAVFAHSSDNHGSVVSKVAKENDDDHGSKVSTVAKDNHGSQVVINVDNRKHEEEGENESEENEHSQKISTPSANTHGSGQLKIKIKVSGNPGSTLSATPSAKVSVSGPFDQVVKALEAILNFLKSLV